MVKTDSHKTDYHHHYHRVKRDHATHHKTNISNIVAIKDERRKVAAAITRGVRDYYYRKASRKF